jgi:hypothetical protein
MCFTHLSRSHMSRKIEYGCVLQYRFFLCAMLNHTKYSHSVIQEHTAASIPSQAGSYFVARDTIAQRPETTVTP